MRISLPVIVSVFAIAAVARAAAPAIELEVATERGMQITAPQEWLQLLASIGIENVRIRGGQPGDEPGVKNDGTAARAHYHVLGVLTAREQLRLPGGTFSRGDRSRLKDYFDRLTADGAESLTAPRGMFGLTESEIKTVFADLAQPVDFETTGLPPRTVLDRLQAKLRLKFAIDAEAERALRAAPSVKDAFKGLSVGTAVAMMLRPNVLVLRPEKARGQPVVLRITLADSNAVSQPTLGKTNDKKITQWPIGWDPSKPLGAIAPSLMERRNAEIDGYTLEEALAAIAPRIKVPMYIDHASLAAHHIEPAKIQVHLARTNTFYKRIIDLVLAQARLGCEVRLDESGTPFLWITR